MVQVDGPAAIPPPLNTTAFDTTEAVPVQPVPDNTGAPNIKPAFSVSINPIPLCAPFPAAFASVIVSVLVPFTLIGLTLYALETVGRAFTCRTAGVKPVVLKLLVALNFDASFV